MKHELSTGIAAVIAAALVVTSSSGALADNPRSVTMATQNVYQGTELEHVLAAKTTPELVQGVATDYANVIATNFPSRAEILAAEIAESAPALVGLQEVALWQAQAPLPSYDFLQILLDALAARGAHYATIITRDNFSVGGVGLFSAGLLRVDLTERTAIIARTDLQTDNLRLSNPQSGAYQQVSVVPTINGPFTLGAGWLAVDAKVRGKTFRFITTHLDGFSTAVAAAQAQELLVGPAAGSPATVVAGDFNSQPSDPAYSTMKSAGFADAWAGDQPTSPGLTCCQVPPDSIINPASQLRSRVDYMFVRGPFSPLDLHLVGDDPSTRTASGLWPSDHAGLVGTLEIGAQPPSQAVTQSPR